MSTSSQENAPGGLPRWFECLAALGALVLLSPLMLMIAGAIKLTSRGPALFRQSRVGKHGDQFDRLKFRSMTEATGDHAGVTASGDSRVTGVGRVLRATKLDELPELFNILRGEMSVVGPRPEIPKFVDMEDPLWQQALSVRPGLTDSVTLLLRDEEALLAAGAERTGQSVEDFYRTVLLPFKLRESAAALEQRSAISDVAIAFRTGVALIKKGTPHGALLETVLSQSETARDSGYDVSE